MADKEKLQFSPRELTVRAQRQLMKDLQQRQEHAGEGDADAFSVYDENIIDGTSLREIAAICDCEVADLDDLRESELDRLAKRCKEANPRFFAMRAKERDRAEALMKGNPQLMQRLLERQLSKQLSSSD